MKAGAIRRGAIGKRPRRDAGAPVAKPRKATPEVAVPKSVQGESVRPVYVWDLVVRSTHWLIVLSIVVLSVTGVYIGRPFMTSSSASADGFLMGWFKVAHFYASIVFALAVAARIVWMFVGKGYASWREFIPTNKQRLRDMWGTFKFYIFLERTPPPAVGHNPLAGFMYVFVFMLYLAMIATGFALYSVSAYTSYMGWWDWLLPMFGGPQSARWLHHVGMWLLLGFMVQHVYSAWLMSKTEKNGCLDSMFTGYKFVPDEGDEGDTEQGGADE